MSVDMTFSHATSLVLLIWVFFLCLLVILAKVYHFYWFAQKNQLFISLIPCNSSYASILLILPLCLITSWHTLPWGVISLGVVLEISDLSFFLIWDVSKLLLRNLVLWTWFLELHSLCLIGCVTGFCYSICYRFYFHLILKESF